MANDVRITVSVTDNASAPLRKVAQETDNLGTSAGGTGASMLTMGLAITAVTSTVGAVVGALASAVAMSAELARVNAQTGAVLRSTGGISGMTADAVRDLASSLETMTGVDEIAIQSAENMLLTFTNIGATTMPAATQAVLDMAVAMNGGLIPSEQELAKTSIQVGRALQDPIDGVTALRRVGVQLSDEQQELVKHLVATGRGAEAQALILKELQVEFGGSAEAASKARGGVDQARDAFEDAGRAIGEKLIKPLQEAQTQFYLFGAASIKSLEELGPKIDGIRVLLGQLQTVLEPAENGLVSFAKDALRPWRLLADTIGETLDRISASDKGAATRGGYSLGQARGDFGMTVGAGSIVPGTNGEFLPPNYDVPLPPGFVPPVVKNGANVFSQPTASGRAGAAQPAYMKTLQDQIEAAYAQGGMRQVEVVRRSQADMMAAVDVAAAKMSIDLGIKLPDATQLMFDKMLAQQTELAAAQEAIANANMLAQIDAYLKGGQAAVDIVKLQQADTAVEISKMANGISETFGIKMPEALGLATKAAAGTASAMAEMGKQAAALAAQLFKTVGNTAQQGAMVGLAGAVIGGNPADIQAAVDASNAISRARNPDIPKSEGGGGPERMGSGGVTINLSGVITDPVATGQAVADALNSASRTTGPLLLAGTVQ